MIQSVQVANATLIDQQINRILTAIRNVPVPNNLTSRLITKLAVKNCGGA